MEKGIPLNTLFHLSWVTLFVPRTAITVAGEIDECRLSKVLLKQESIMPRIYKGCGHLTLF